MPHNHNNQSEYLKLQRAQAIGQLVGSFSILSAVFKYLMIPNSKGVMGLIFAFLVFPLMYSASLIFNLDFARFSFIYIVLICCGYLLNLFSSSSLQNVILTLTALALIAGIVECLFSKLDHRKLLDEENWFLFIQIIIICLIFYLLFFLIKLHF